MEKCLQTARRVRYGAPAIDDQENAEAFARLHGKGPKRARVPVSAKAGKNEPYCATAQWLRVFRNVEQDHCLFAPGANPGFKRQVRFNFKPMAASRAMCILAHGLPPDAKMLAIHSCGNGHLSCVNPKHLRWGTTKDNAKDAALHHGKAARITDTVTRAAGLHPLPKVAAVLSGETAESIRAAKK
jgi:hypothetical protein